MWRNISWNSTDSTLPDGMHKHEPGPYFKTPSIQSASSSASASQAIAGATTAALATNTDSTVTATATTSIKTATQAAHIAPGLEPITVVAPSNKKAVTIGANKQDSIDSAGSSSRLSLARVPSVGAAGTPTRKNSPTTPLAGVVALSSLSSPQKSASSSCASLSGAGQPPVVVAHVARRTRFAKDTATGRQQASGATSAAQQTSGSAAASASTPPHNQGFRSRLSSISGALQHPKLAKRLFHHGDHHHGNQATGGGGDLQHASTVQITTTSIDSPQHGPSASVASASGGGGGSGGDKSNPSSISDEPRLLTSSSGRRLSQLFLPQIGPNQIMLNQMADPYANNELIPPHLLGLYGQPPLVAGAMGSASSSGHRSSWADTSLFGRLSNVRPSLDSGYQGVGATGQLRHSFDARSEQCNEQEHEDRPNCVQIMKKLFFSLLLGTIIALCWVMIIHTLKWIAIRGNEFELLSAHQQSSGSSSSSHSHSNHNTLNNFNIIATNAVDLNLNELDNNNSNNNGQDIHLTRQLSAAAAAPQARALSSLSQDSTPSGAPPLKPLRESAAEEDATSFVHKRSLHDRDGNQVYQVASRGETQFDKRKGRRREASQQGNNNNNNSSSSSSKVDGNCNDCIGLSNSSEPAASVGDQAGSDQVPIPVLTSSGSSKTTATTAPSVRDEINNWPDKTTTAGLTETATAQTISRSRSSLARRQAHGGGGATIDQVQPDEEQPIVGDYLPTPLAEVNDDDDDNAGGGGPIVASSIQQQPNYHQINQQQHRRRQQQQQQHNQTVRPGSKRSDHQRGQQHTTGTGLAIASGGANLTTNSSSSRRNRRPTIPVASDLDLVSLPSERNSTAIRLSDRSRDDDDDANGRDDDSGALESHKTSAMASNGGADDSLLIDQQSSGMITGNQVGSDAMLPGVGPVQPASLLDRSGQPTTAGLVYRAPFFTSWFVSTWNILFMPVFTLISSCCFRNEDSTTKKLLVESISQFMDNGLTTLQFLGRCAFFSVLWIGTIFGIVYSLAHLDATVVMALFACSAALVYLLSWVLLHQQFVGVRIVAVIICTTGIALLAYMDNSRTLGSVLIVAGSALCSAVYKVIYQRMFGFWSIAQMSLFFTLIGLFNAFLMWPIALLLYFLGVELIVWRYIPWMHLTAAGALHLTANIVAYFGPICSYDIFLTLGLLFAVVLSAVIDVTFYKITFFGMKLAGVLLLMIGFLVCLLPENWNECLYDLANERFIRWKKQRSLKKSRNKVQDMSTGQMSRLRTPSGRVK